MMNNITVIDKEDGMVELRRQDGQLLEMAKETYEMCASLLDLITGTQPKILKAAVDHYSKKEERVSRLMHGSTLLYLQQNHPDIISA